MQCTYLAEAVVLEDLLHIIHLGQQPDGAAVKQLRLQHSKKPESATMHMLTV